MKPLFRRAIFFLGIWLTIAFLTALALMPENPVNANQPTAAEFEAEVRKLESAYKSNPKDDLLRGRLLMAYQQMSALLVKENNLNDALHYLQWADDLQAGDAGKFSQSGGGYFAVGAAFVEQGDLRQAQDNFDLALQKNPQDENLRKAIATVLHNAGVAKINLKQLQESVPYLELSVQYYDKLQNTWETLGDLAYAKQDLRKAQQCWQKANALGSTLDLKAKLEKLGREAGVELGLAQYGASHFIIRYKRSNETYQGQQLKQLLNNAYRDISRDLNYYPDIMIPVILYDQAEFAQIVNSPHWSAGVYDGKIRLPAYEEGKSDERELTRVIYHELTHAFVVDMVGNACPIWLNEGLAQHEENKVVPVDISNLKNSLAKGRYYQYETLKAGLENLLETDQVAVFYQQSYVMTKFLIERYRVHRVKEMLEIMKAGESFEAALRKTTGLSIEQLEQKWQEALR
ncbi:MAG: hypothetical protein HY587_04030 [Candidatus Omnitrophica bacterium]|nr:hypothetical protein [Candidatus Omnitrophota bacterium]